MNALMVLWDASAPEERDAFVQILADALAPAILARMPTEPAAADGWMSSADAARYLGMSLNAFKKHMHEIPSEQDAPGCRRWYRGADLDAWRKGQRFHSASKRAA